MLRKLTPRHTPHPQRGEGIESFTDSTSATQGARETVKPAFTLAEVLITLAIIGIVAALTIPGLMTNINSKVVENQKKVMTGKIVQGLNLLNSQENGLTKTYANSEEFVRALSKYMKMSTICGAYSLGDCFGFESVYDNQGNPYSLYHMYADDLNLDYSDGWSSLAGFVMADGTPLIVSWNTKCSSEITLDPDQPLKSIPTNCFAGVYDNNGSRNPNMYGKDIQSIGAALLGAKYPGVRVSGIGYVYDMGRMSEDLAISIDSPDMHKYDPEYYQYCQKNSCTGVSYYAGAKKACEDLGMRLPTESELVGIGSVLSYNPGVAERGGLYLRSDNHGADLCYTAVYPGSNYGGCQSGSKESAFVNVLCIGK